MGNLLIPNQTRSSLTLSTTPQHSLTKRSLPFLKDLVRIDYERMFEDFTESEKLPYVIGYQNLPLDIKSKVVDIVKKKKPVKGQCYLYSQFISSQIDGVNQVLGFLKMGKDFRDFFVSYLMNLGITPQPFVKYEDWEEDGFIFDEKYNLWGPHGWNEYRGVYFDCLNEEVYKKPPMNYKGTDYRMIDYKRSFNYKQSQKLEVYINYSHISGSLSS
jgi:hypothetical protein